MQNILVIGAGRSTATLINYIYNKSTQHGWVVTVADNCSKMLASKAKGKDQLQTVKLDIYNDVDRQALINSQDLVISMLPARLHYLPAKDCLKLNKHFINASYVTPELMDTYRAGVNKGLIFMGELGLDPGLDHLSAMKMLDSIRANAGSILSFQSFAGGLVAPKYDDNPWNYKFSWNPRNVVLAGQGTAQYKLKGCNYFTPYNHLFAQSNTLVIKNVGDFDWYPNRDSMSYIERYQLADCPTVIRGTLRRTGYCEAWNCLVKLGLTDDKTTLSYMDKMTYADWIRGIIRISDKEELRPELAVYLGIEENGIIMSKLEYLGLLSDTQIELTEGTSAQILESILKRKWELKKGETDLIVMKHVIRYEKEGKEYEARAVLYYEGDDEENTAMAQLVGLPLAIMAENIMLKKITNHENLIPIEKHIYLPILEQLEDLGIKFKESVHEL